MARPTTGSAPRGPQHDGPRINEMIRTPKVRLVDENGDMVGVVSVQEALQMARDAGLDLVEISPNAEPPVCKILDYGKYKYELQKKKNAERKKQKIVEIKEVKIRPSIEEHDYQTKLRSAQRFVAEGDKVKITMRFRGREMDRTEIGKALLDRFCGDLGEGVKVESPAKMEGRQMVMVVSPKS